MVDTNLRGCQSDDLLGKTLFELERFDFIGLSI
jgi:hypothetical protein